MTEFLWDGGLPETVEDKIQIFDGTGMAKMMHNYACSQCWGELSSSPLPGDQWMVYCKRCGEDKGFVSKTFVERQRTQDHFDYMDVLHMMNSAHLLPERELTEKDKRIFEELGL